MSTTTAPLPTAQHLAAAQSRLDATRPRSDTATRPFASVGGIYAETDGDRVAYAMIEDAVAFAGTFPGRELCHASARAIAERIASDASHPLHGEFWSLIDAEIEELRAECRAMRGD